MNEGDMAAPDGHYTLALRHVIITHYYERYAIDKKLRYRRSYHATVSIYQLTRRHEGSYATASSRLIPFHGFIRVTPTPRNAITVTPKLAADNTP